MGLSAVRLVIQVSIIMVIDEPTTGLCTTTSLVIYCTGCAFDLYCFMVKFVKCRLSARHVVQFLVLTVCMRLTQHL